MKSRKLLAISIAFALSNNLVAGEITLTPFATHIDYAQHEIISDFVLTRFNGTSEVFSSAVGENLFQFSGSSNVPSTNYLDLDVEITPLGGGGGGGVFIPNSSPIQTIGSAREFPDEEIQPAPFLVWLGAGAISASTCATGWFMARRVLISDCEQQGGSWSNLSVGSCGVGTGSSIDCDLDENDDESNALISWQNFAWSNFPWTYQFQNHILDLSIPSSY